METNDAYGCPGGRSAIVARVATRAELTSSRAFLASLMAKECNPVPATACWIGHRKGLGGSMRYNLFGNTGLLVSELCLGTMTFGGKGFWEVVGRLGTKEVENIVGTAL